MHKDANDREVPGTDACCGQPADWIAPSLFRTLADPTRVEILAWLAAQGDERSVSEVAACCSVDLSVVSRHLATLRDAGVVEARRLGREVRYRLAPGELVAALRGFAAAMEACCPGGGAPPPVRAEPLALEDKVDSGPACCCGPRTPGPPPDDAARMRQPFVIGAVETPAGPVPRVGSRWSARDRLGALRARLGLGRMAYAVVPGLYALGSPDGRSPVFVGANYKLSFDHLRRALAGRPAWLLVLDTAGINVWCAAGKGTFGTDELVGRLASTRLGEIVTGRRLVVPQLGAPGVAAHEVKARSGFRILYGPVMAVDLPAYMDAGCKATPAMRRKRFPLAERAALVPMELVPAASGWLVALAGALLVGGLVGPGPFLEAATHHGFPLALALGAGVLAGGGLVPLLLPWLPGRAFSVKGAAVGLLVASALVLWRAGHGAPAGGAGVLEAVSWLLAVPALVAFMAMNFTGASTYTSLSGVEKEMRLAVPLQLGAAVLGVGAWIAAGLLS